MIYIAFKCSLDLYNISNFTVNQTFSIMNKLFFKVKKHVVLHGCHGCYTITCSCLNFFWSLAMFTLLYAPLDPCKLCWKQKELFFLIKILSRKPIFFQHQTNWHNESLQCCCHTITCWHLKLFWSLVMFTLLYLPWDPYKLCWK